MPALEDAITGNTMEIVGRAAQVNMPSDPSIAGCVRITSADGDAIDVTENNALRVSLGNAIFWDQVDGSSVDTNKWAPVVSTMTITNSSGFYNLNANSTTTASAYAILPSIKFMPLYGTLPLKLEMNGKVVNLPQANCTGEIGIGTVATNAAPTDGAFFRWTPAGQFVCGINNGGVELLSAALTGTITDTDGFSTINMPPSTSIIHLYAIEVVEDRVLFFIDDILVSDLSVPSGQAYPFASGRQQIFARVWNGTTPSVAGQISIGQVVVKQEDLNQNKPWDKILASIGRSWYQSPTAFTQTTNHTNSTAPVAITLSNTALGDATYAKLGGKFAISSQAAGATDGIVFGYQNVTGYQLSIGGISISTVITGAAIVTATVLDWSIGANSSAISLATTDGTNTWAPRRIPLGVQGFAALSGIGSTANDITRVFDREVIIDSGRFFHIIVSIPNGANTGSLVYRGAVTVLGGVHE